MLLKVDVAGATEARATTAGMKALNNTMMVRDSQISVNSQYQSCIVFILWKIDTERKDDWNVRRSSWPYMSIAYGCHCNLTSVSTVNGDTDPSYVDPDVNSWVLLFAELYRQCSAYNVFHSRFNSRTMLQLFWLVRSCQSAFRTSCK